MGDKELASGTSSAGHVLASVWLEPLISQGSQEVLRRFQSESYHILFTGTTQDCATALLVVGPSPHGVSQLRYRLQLCASTRRFHSNSYHTFYGHHPGLCNCPVSSWPFATGGISDEISATTTLPPRGVSISQVEISATTCCLHEAFSLISHFLRAPPKTVSSWLFATGGISVEISATTMLPP